MHYSGNWFNSKAKSRKGSSHYSRNRISKWGKDCCSGDHPQTGHWEETCDSRQTDLCTQVDNGAVLSITWVTFAADARSLKTQPVPVLLSIKLISLLTLMEKAPTLFGPTWIHSALAWHPPFPSRHGFISVEMKNTQNYREIIQRHQKFPDYHLSYSKKPKLHA